MMQVGNINIEKFKVPFVETDSTVAHSRSLNSKRHRRGTEAGEPTMLAGFSLSPGATPSRVIFPTKSSPLTSSSFHGIRIPIPTPTPSSLLRLRAQLPSSVVAAAAKRAEELKTKTTEDVNEEILRLKGELFMLRLQRSAREDFKPSEFGRMRKRIARLLTVKREREIEQGIGKRLSRKLNKERKRSIVVKPPASLKKLQEENAAKGAEKTS
ncbi:LOW QUALITY PROTEIN: hypothetical protein Cgig2_002811 [Carnegiea gigantea]|uniref:Large ribosomal subunit protein uL29c n=1 Tax=Carnegiea gigantea TaxID=171969 RepID=A0A9Q1KPP8_9CARY|nr:LOW QUALITY PROTEIN: hypothetical protein Cgig2_002811 [Carnegiea gigantea]